MSSPILNTSNQTTAARWSSPPNQKETTKNGLIATAAAGGIAAVSAFFITLSLGVAPPIAIVIALAAGGIAARLTYLFVSSQLSNPSPIEQEQQIKHEANITVQKARQQITRETNAMQQGEQQAMACLQHTVQQVEQSRQALAGRYTQETRPEELQRVYQDAQKEYDSIPKNEENRGRREEALRRYLTLEPTKRLQRLKSYFQYQNEYFDDYMRSAFNRYTGPYIGTPTREHILAPYRARYPNLVPQAA